MLGPYRRLMSKLVGVGHVPDPIYSQALRLNLSKRFLNFFNRLIKA
jgi:hypothetical protein